MPSAIDLTRKANREYSTLYNDPCCKVSSSRTSEKFTDKSSLTIVHRLGVENSFIVVDTNGDVVEPTINDDGTTAVITFSTPVSGTIAYWVKA